MVAHLRGRATGRTSRALPYAPASINAARITGSEIFATLFWNDATTSLRGRAMVIA